MEDNNNFNWGGMLGSIGGSLLGGFMNVGSRRRDMQYQKEMADYNAQLQREQGKFFNDLAFEQWNRTNYGAQVDHMKNAGLNVGLMYGGSGQGGTTQGAQAPTVGAGNPNPNIMEMGLKAGLMGAQIENIKADTKMKEAGTGNLNQDTELKGIQTLNTQTQNELNKLSLEIGNATKEDQIDEVFYRVEGLVKQNAKTDEEKKLIIAQVTETAAKTKLHEMNIKVGEESIKKMIQDVQIGWASIQNGISSIQAQLGQNKIMALNGKAQLYKMKQDFILGVMQNNVEWGKLNIEQQKVFTQLFNGMLNATTGNTTTTEGWSEKSGHYQSKTTKQ